MPEDSADSAAVWRQFLARINGAPWSAKGGPASLTRLVTALRKSRVKTGRHC
jgi:hypothetical protein